MLCASLTPATLDDIFNFDITGADCVEIRLDYLKDPRQSLDVSWDRIDVPVIATCRRRVRGGQFDGSLEEETQILEAAVRNGARYVDIDYRDVVPMGGAKLIASYVNFEETPPDLMTLLKAVCDGPARIAKIAVRVRSWADNRRLLELYEHSWPKPIIVIGMGEIGQITRVLGPSRGSYLTYATLSQKGTASAPGQLTVPEMLRSYRYRRIHAGTRLFGVVGNPVSHSSGPIRHNAAFEAARIDFAYLKFLVTDVHDFFESARAIGIQGFSVTMPHKIAVIPFLEQISEGALEVGAVNTVVWQDDGWFGYNTDVDGVRAALDSIHFEPAGKRVVILGNKGAAKAAATALKNAAKVTMLSRLEIPTVHAHESDLLINATPVGMAPYIDASPVEGRIPADVVFDMVYNPPMTRLLQLAKEQGKTIVPGTVMYDAQAARQFEIWTGQPPPPGIYGAR